MKTLLVIVFFCVAVGLIVFVSAGENFNAFLQTADSNSMNHDKSTSQNSDNSAVSFLNSLNDAQRKKALMPIDDSSREHWHYLPTTMFERGGILLNELNSEQKRLAFAVLKSHLSKTGYDKIQQIIELENVLAELTNNPNTRDPEKYVLAFYGDPAKDNLWAWSFEGHHISLNFTVSNDKVSIVPRFLGANPATIKTGKRKGERTLAEEEDLGLELVNSLNSEQKKQAIIQDSTFYDIVSGNKSEVSPFKSFGIKMKDLVKSQQQTLQQLIDVYLLVMPKELAEKRLENLKKEDFDEIQFGWAGATEKGKPHYYRIQGRTFLIEFDNTQNNANHIHTVWRDFKGDFGKDLIKEHYQKSDHHK